jgi:predicted secreted protein
MVDLITEKMTTSSLKKIGIFCIILIAFACNIKKGGSTSNKTSMKDTLIFIGCQEQIKLVAGTVAKIKLEAIEGTGYQWLVKGPTTLLQQIDANILEYSASENKEGMPGQASFQVLRFKAINAGEEVIQLEYRKTFEIGIEKRCIIKFIIEK